MAKQNGKNKIIKRTISAQSIEAFLERLAETSNVSQSAAGAGLTTGQIYRKRQASQDFRARWADALREGYARLEADMLAEARGKLDIGVSVEELKVRTMRHRLSLNLLAAHRKSVTAAAQMKIVHSRSGAKADLVSRLTALRERHQVLEAEDGA